MATTSYATDGKCHAAPRGSFNHECGKPADWIGVTAKGFASGWCKSCRERGVETGGVVEWRPALSAAA